MKRFKITYIIEIKGNEQNEYAECEDEVKCITSDLIGKGFYIKSITKWSASQRRYYTENVQRNHMYELYDERRNYRNFIDMMNRKSA